MVRFDIWSSDDELEESAGADGFGAALVLAFDGAGAAGFAVFVFAAGALPPAPTLKLHEESTDVSASVITNRPIRLVIPILLIRWFLSRNAQSCSCAIVRLRRRRRRTRLHPASRQTPGFSLWLMS
jgi:hypothetical protein